MSILISAIIGGFLGFILPSYLEEEHGWNYGLALLVTLFIGAAQGVFWGLVL